MLRKNILLKNKNVKPWTSDPIQNIKTKKVEVAIRYYKNNAIGVSAAIL